MISAIFSIWDADGGSCSDVPGAICKTFDGEGEGYQTMLPYQWVGGHYYRTRVWAVGKDSAGESWLGAVLDDTLGTEAIIGLIHVPTGRGSLSNDIFTWVEYYGPKVDDCHQLPISVVFFGPPHANAGTVVAGSPASHYGAGACSSRLSNYGGWARHPNGWGANHKLQYFLRRHWHESGEPRIDLTRSNIVAR